MRRSTFQLSAGLALMVFSACGVDERALDYEFHALEAAGSSAAGSQSGLADAGDLGSGDSAPDAGEGSVLRGGASNASGGTAGSTGGATTGSGAASGGGQAGEATGGVGGGRAADAGAPGSSGGRGLLPCGDLNDNGVDDCSETLVQNSRFDSTLSGWQAEPDADSVWDAGDASAQAGSGSLRLTSARAVVQAVGGTVTGVHQCLRVKLDDIFDFAAQVKLADGQTDGSAGVNAWLFDDDSCQGNLVPSGFMISGGVVGSWTLLKGNLWIPRGVHSMYVRLVAIKPFTQPLLSVSFDDVLVAKR